MLKNAAQSILACFCQLKKCSNRAAAVIMATKPNMRRTNCELLEKWVSPDSVKSNRNSELIGPCSTEVINQRHFNGGVAVQLRVRERRHLLRRTSQARVPSSNPPCR